MSKEMKYSGLSWAGDIPINWDVVSFNNATNRVATGLNPRDNFKLDKESKFYYVTIRNFKNGKLFLDDKCDRINEKAFRVIQERARVKKGDILFASIAKEGQCYVVKEEPSNWAINESVFTIEPNSQVMDSNYLYYHLIDNGYYGDLLLDATGSTFTSIKQKKLKSSVLVCPSLSEQRKIAHVLDEKCEKVDLLIANQERQIEKLKSYKQSLISQAVTKGLNSDVEMKDSGVEWIGYIPKQWNIIRGKAILENLSRKVESDMDVITCFRDGEVTLRKNRREEGFTFSDKEIGYQGIYPGDLVVHGMDGFAGAIGISDSKGKGSPILIVCDSNENKTYLMYYLRNLAYRDIFLALSTGIRVRSCDLRWNKLSVLPFIIPPIDEQNRIVEYLNERCAQIDNLIKIKQSKIQKLNEYKKSLIYEYVTGKKQVI